MKAVGLITEYNPLHNGHIHHLTASKELTGAEVAVCVMSGNFVQRGEPAIIDKYSRAKAAIESGINLVVELPTYYALSSAEWFATGSVLTLDALKTDSLVFGSECGNIDALSKCADILLNEPVEFKDTLKAALALGNSFPKARHMALSQVYGEELAAVCDSPNNILGIEYIKAIKQFNCSIVPETIKRIESSYHDTTLTKDTELGIASATAIRNGITQHINNLSEYMPVAMSATFDEYIGKTSPVLPDHFSTILNYKISEIMYRSLHNKDRFSYELCQYIDVTGDLANRLFSIHRDGMSFSEYAEALKNKQYTMTRINRVLMHIILGLTVNLKAKYESGKIPYIRILGMDKKGQDYLNSVKKKIETPMIIKPANYKDLLSEDLYAVSVYNQTISATYGTTPIDEYRQGIYIK